MNSRTAATPLARRRAFVRRLRATLEAVARRRRKGWLDASAWLRARCGLSLRGYHHLQAGRLERVPSEAVRRLGQIMEAK